MLVCLVCLVCLEYLECLSVSFSFLTLLMESYTCYKCGFQHDSSTCSQAGPLEADKSVHLENPQLSNQAVRGIQVLGLSSGRTTLKSLEIV